MCRHETVYTFRCRHYLTVVQPDDREDTSNWREKLTKIVIQECTQRYILLPVNSLTSFLWYLFLFFIESDVYCYVYPSSNTLQFHEVDLISMVIMATDKVKFVYEVSTLKCLHFGVTSMYRQ